MYFCWQSTWERKERLMLEDKKCVDFHAHPVTDAFRAALSELGIDPMEEDGFPRSGHGGYDGIREKIYGENAIRLLKGLNA